MGWLLEPNGNKGGVCPKSACFNLDYCYKDAPCPKDKSFCIIETGGPSCNSRACVGYVT